MADYSDYYEEIMGEYDRLRMKNRQELSERRQKVCSLIPAIRKLDEEISTISTQSAKRYLLGEDAALSDLSDRIEKLSARKRAILVKKGYPADYLDPVYTCPDCKDSGYKGNSMCHCLKSRLSLAFSRESSNIQHMLLRQNFGTFNINVYAPEYRNDMEDIRLKALEFTRDFRKSRPGLLFQGGVGSGKTFISCCIAGELIKQGFSVLYLSAFRLFETMTRVSFNRDLCSSYDRALYDDIFNSDLLIIDDLGTEKSGGYSSSHLFAILNERELRFCSTLINTNLSFGQLQDSYTERCVSRLFTRYNVYRFRSDDVRLRLAMM